MVRHVDQVIWKNGTLEMVGCDQEQWKNGTLGMVRHEPWCDENNGMIEPSKW